jgi:hypothetical protein
MAIVVDSSQWTGQRDDTPLAVPVVWGEFESGIARDNALSRLRSAGAQDHEGPAPSTAGMTPPVEATNQGQVPAPDEHPEQASRRNLRQNAVGIAMAGSAMAAAGLVIATGGAALPAVAAAAATGAGVGAVGETVGNAAATGSTDSGGAIEPPATAQGPVIGLQAPNQEARERAEQLLREVGAKRVFVQETRAG